MNPANAGSNWINPWSDGTNNNWPTSWFGQKQMAGNPAPPNGYQDLSEQLQSLNQRLGQFDNDNQQLLADLAATKQKLQASNDYNYQLKQQLTDSLAQLQQLQNSKTSMEQQLAAAQARGNGGNLIQTSSNGVPAQLPSGAMLKANNSLLQKVGLIQLPGVTTRMDGDVIRIEFPSDQLFEPNTYRISSGFVPLLQQLSATITRNFPEQIIGIEAHWDNTPLQNATPHQLTATQSLAVFDQLQKSGLSAQQMFTMATGANRPRYPASLGAGSNPNRRVEIVIYPETYTGR